MWIAFLIGLALLGSGLLAYGVYRVGWISIPAPERRVGCIDGLRGYLAIAVFFHHCIIWLYVLRGKDWNGPHGNVHSNAGQASVAVFFMITGVLFYPKILRRLSDGEWIGHFISRICRLTPLMWFATALVVGIVLYQNEFQIVSPPSAIVICLLQWLAFWKTPNLFGHAHTERIIAGVTWSLAYEWGFYILLPGLSRLMNLFRTRIRPIFLLLAVFLYLEWLIYRHYIGPRYYVLFVVGMLAAEAVKFQKFAAFLRTPVAALVGLAAVTSEFVFCPTAFAVLPPLLLGVFFLPVVAGNSYFGILTLPSSIVLGEISYGIYLLHGILLYIALNSMIYKPGPFVIPLMAPIVVAVTILTHRLIEIPAIEFGRRMARKVQNVQLRVAGTRAAQSPQPAPETAA
jgi:peptidoglycan/LPS O-acetylase OafA/YrhL